MLSIAERIARLTHWQVFAIIWFFFVGVWFVQPRLNRMLSEGDTA